MKHKRELTAAGKEKLRELSNQLFARCEDVTDAKGAREATELLEKIALAREALAADEPLVLKDLQPGQSTPEALAPHLHVLLAQARAWRMVRMVRANRAPFGSGYETRSPLEYFE